MKYSNKSFLITLAIMFLTCCASMENITDINGSYTIKQDDDLSYLNSFADIKTNFSIKIDSNASAESIELAKKITANSDEVLLKLASLALFNDSVLYRSVMNRMVISDTAVILYSDSLNVNKVYPITNRWISEENIFLSNERDTIVVCKKGNNTLSVNFGKDTDLTVYKED